MLSHSDLKKGVKFLLDNKPYEVIEFNFIFKGRGQSTVQAKIKNLLTNEVITKTFHASDKLEELETEKIDLEFIYSKKGEFFFKDINDPSRRYILIEEALGNKSLFLKPGFKTNGYLYKDKLLNIELPIKMNFKVIEASPGLRGGREQPGTKPVVIETGAVIQAPLFIKAGDIIEVNTEKGEYVRRIIEK